MSGSLARGLKRLAPPGSCQGAIERIRFTFNYFVPKDDIFVYIISVYEIFKEGNIYVALAPELNVSNFAILLMMQKGP